MLSCTSYVEHTGGMLYVRVGSSLMSSSRAALSLLS
jgi:hypothetical protein